MSIRLGSSLAFGGTENYTDSFYVFQQAESANLHGYLQTLLT